VGQTSDPVSRVVCASCGVGVERRRTERRRGERRINPGDAIDVTRIEHENLATEIAEHGRLLRSIEQQLQTVRDRVNRLSRGLPNDRPGDASGSQ
jgi:hypothetical protein